MIDAEKNERLLEFAGIQYMGRADNSLGEHGECWLYPDRSICFTVPDLLHSLDALFEHVVPKLTMCNVSGFAGLFTWNVCCLSESLAYGIATVDIGPTNKDAALALAEAVLKMLEVK